MKSIIFSVIFSSFISMIFALRAPIPREYVVTNDISEFELERSNQVALIFKNFNYQRRFHFYLENEDEIKSSNFKYIGVTRSPCEDLENETCDDDNTIFTFRSNGIGNNKEFPLLMFKYVSKQKTDYAYVSFKLPNEELDNASIIKPENNEVYDVESGSFIKVEVTGGSGGNGTNWTLKNKEEIENSDWIEYYGSSSESCSNPIGVPPRSGGCSVPVTYVFKIKNVSDESLMQKIVLVKGIAWNPSFSETTEFTFKLKRKSERLCTKDGYNCCSKDNNTVFFTDYNGEWGIENGDWCYIGNRNTCIGKYGYECCPENTETIYTDNQGQWGYVNDEWCYNIVLYA